jgi:hypothetical protein
VSAMLERLLRHARRFGSEGVYEAAESLLTPSELATLADTLVSRNRASFARRRDGSREGDPSPIPAKTRNACRSCGTVLERSARGPVATYCSPSCRQRAYRRRARA